MTDVERRTLPATSVPVWVSRAGVVCMAAGASAGWGIVLAASGMALLAVTELVAITARNSTYPVTAPVFSMRSTASRAWRSVWG